MTLADAVKGHLLLVEHVGGERAFRRRLMELGFVPGTRVELTGVAPLGDPMEFLLRGSSLSIRRGEAREVRVVAVTSAAKDPIRARVPSVDLADCA